MNLHHSTTKHEHVYIHTYMNTYTYTYIHTDNNYKYICLHIRREATNEFYLYKNTLKMVKFLMAFIIVL